MSTNMSKIFKSQLGLAPIIIILIIIGVVLLGMGIVYLYQQLNIEEKSGLISPPTTQSDKPDLIIESILYREVPPSPPDMSLDKILEFTLRVKNIGRSSSNDRFYISNTRSNSDVASNYYSHTQIANQKKQSIKPDGVLEIKITDSINEDATTVRFLLNTEGKPDSRGDTLPRVEEANYRNNTYKLRLN